MSLNPNPQAFISQINNRLNEIYKKMYEQNAVQQREIEDLKRTILILLPQVKELEKRMGINIKQYIDDYLDKLDIPDMVERIVEELVEHDIEALVTRLVEEKMGNYVLKSNVKHDSTGTFTQDDIFDVPTTQSLLSQKLDSSSVKETYNSGSASTVYSTSYINGLMNLAQGEQPESISLPTTARVNELLGDYLPRTSIDKTSSETTSSIRVYSEGRVNELLGNYVPTSSLKDSQTTSSSTTIYTTNAINTMLGDYVPKTDVLKSKPSGAVSDDKILNANTTLGLLDEKLNASAITTTTSEGTPTANTSVYSSAKTDELLNSKVNTSSVISTKNDDPTSDQIYNAAYINALEETISGDYIKATGETEIDGVVLKPKSGTSDFSFQIARGGILYSETIQGWKNGDPAP